MATNDQMDRSFLTASVPELLKKLTTQEKISLLAGKDWWSTVPVARLNIPSIKVTDGPNGARGGSFFKMTPASALPNATCIGASFSKPLVEEAGALLAAETQARNAVCLLAPTINIQRSPLGGRAFESFSEDPTHSGLIAASYVNGLQAKGVSATIKHFVANDQEHERMGEDSIVSQRALREIYLRPFQIAQKLSKPWAYMTSYNKLNGTHCSENEWLLQQVLRKEWGHDGLIMSDWYGTYSVSESINAGLNLEMPGKAIWRDSKLINHLIGAHKIDLRAIDKVAGELLRWIQKCAKENEELVYAKPSEEKTRHDEKEADAKILRKIGGEGIVLLKNEGNVLPIQGKKRVAVIGPNAKAKVITGGGSAQLRAAWSQTPWEGLESNKPDDVTLDYSLGAFTAKFLPPLDSSFTAVDGSAGFTLRHYPIEGGKQGSKAVVEETWDSSDMFMGDFYHPDLTGGYFTEVESIFTSPVDGEYEFGLCVTGQGWVYVDDKQIIDNASKQTMGESFFNCGTVEVKATVPVKKGQQYKVRMLHDSRHPEDRQNGDSTPFAIVGIRLGAFVKYDPDTAIREAADLASQSDSAVLVVGLNADWESEGYDRPTLSLPLKTDELITKVAEAQPNTIVVIQAGSAVSMPWIEKVKGVVYAWYGGNEGGNAISDIIYGKINPSGRLPITLPVREADVAAKLNYKSARGQIYYEEGIWVGYKHHNARSIAPLFPFGHGLSYTTFEYSNLKLTTPPPTGSVKADEWKLTASVTVKNTGKVKGSHSVHFYTLPPKETATGLKHPEWTLQGFTKVYDLAPGAEETV